MAKKVLHWIRFPQKTEYSQTRNGVSHLTKGSTGKDAEKSKQLLIGTEPTLKAKKDPFRNMNWLEVSETRLSLPAGHQPFRGKGACCRRMHVQMRHTGTDGWLFGPPASERCPGSEERLFTALGR
jgi:hypothetical protein